MWYLVRCFVRLLPLNTFISHFEHNLAHMPSPLMGWYGLYHWYDAYNNLICKHMADESVVHPFLTLRDMIGVIMSPITHFCAMCAENHLCNFKRFTVAYFHFPIFFRFGRNVHGRNVRGWTVHGRTVLGRNVRGRNVRGRNVLHSFVLYMSMNIWIWIVSVLVFFISFGTLLTLPCYDTLRLSQDNADNLSFPMLCDDSEHHIHLISLKYV